MMGNPAMMGGGAAAPPPAEDTNKLVDLSDKIDKSQSCARNEAPNYPWTNLLIGDSRLACRTDADEQLILHVAFRDTIRVREMVYHVCEMYMRDKMPNELGYPCFGQHAQGTMRTDRSNAVQSTSFLTNSSCFLT